MMKLDFYFAGVTRNLYWWMGMCAMGLGVARSFIIQQVSPSPPPIPRSLAVAFLSFSLFVDSLKLARPVLCHSGWSGVGGVKRSWGGAAGDNGGLGAAAAVVCGVHHVPSPPLAPHAPLLPGSLPGLLPPPNTPPSLPSPRPIFSAPGQGWRLLMSV